MTSLADLLNGEKSIVGVKGAVTLVTPIGLSREEIDWAKDYLSGFNPKAIVRHLSAKRELIKVSDIKTIFYIGHNPDDWGIMIGDSLFPFSSCGYAPVGRQESARAATPSQAL